MDEASEMFTQMSGDDEEVDAGELVQILNKTFAKDVKTSGFTMETARSLIALKDVCFNFKSIIFIFYFLSLLFYYFITERLER